MLDHRPHTDKYFLRTNQILKTIGLNPVVSIVVFARGTGKVAGLDETVALIRNHAPQAKIWKTKSQDFTDKQPLIVINAPVQDIVELETVYLGILSDALSRANGYTPPSMQDVATKFKALKDIYNEIPMIYFGARHYHYSLDKQIAKAALDNGAVQTSTDEGSTNIGQEGVGTMPHLLPILLASKYGKKNATLKAAQLFDTHISHDVPRITLTDTFNKEITDSLAVAEYFQQRKHSVRIDTCSECTPEGSDNGNGVTLDSVKRLREELDNHNYEKCSIFLSGGFGDEAKARKFADAHIKFKQKSGRDLFEGVGVGEISKGVFCTADVFMVEDRPLSKAGRQFAVDINEMSQQ